jgi:hypothetical protein
VVFVAVPTLAHASIGTHKTRFAMTTMRVAWFYWVNWGDCTTVEALNKCKVPAVESRECENLLSPLNICIQFVKKIILEFGFV